MPVDMCAAALAPLPHVFSDQQDITSVGANQPSLIFVELVALFLQKRKVRAARHLQVRVEAHQMQLRAQHASRQSGSGHQRHYKRSWMLIGSISLQHVGVLSVYVVHGLMCVAFLGWPVRLRPVMPWY